MGSLTISAEDYADIMTDQSEWYWKLIVIQEVT
jgi:hypothetical protein